MGANAPSEHPQRVQRVRAPLRCARTGRFWHGVFSLLVRPRVEPNERAMTFAHLLLPIVAALWLTACGLDPQDGALSPEAATLVDDQNESRDVLQVGSAVAALPVYALSGSTLTLADAVTRQSSVPERMADPNCLEVETDGNVVRYTLDRCSGPWGLFEVSGVQTATFSPGSNAGSELGSFVIEVVSSELTINGRSASHDVRAEVTVSESEATLAYQGLFEGNSSFRDVSHEVDLVLGFGSDGVFTLRGATHAKVGLRDLRVELDLQREGPPGTCFDGTVVLERRRGALTVTLAFDGSDEYVARTSRGGRGTFDLDCSPVEP
jgi:hypothetical protein